MVSGNGEAGRITCSEGWKVILTFASPLVYCFFEHVDEHVQYYGPFSVLTWNCRYF